MENKEELYNKCLSILKIIYIVSKSEDDLIDILDYLIYIIEKENVKSNLNNFNSTIELDIIENPIILKPIVREVYFNPDSD